MPYSASTLKNLQWLVEPAIMLRRLVCRFPSRLRGSCFTAFRIVTRW